MSAGADRRPDRAALLQALSDELQITFAGYPELGGTATPARMKAYGDQLCHVRDVLELRLAFSLARRRSPANVPASAALVREALDELQRRGGHVPPPVKASTVLPPAPRFAEADAWLEANAWALDLVEGELEKLTRDWPPQLLGDRARMRPIARLLVFNAHARRAAQSA